MGELFGSQEKWSKCGNHLSNSYTESYHYFPETMLPTCSIQALSNTTRSFSLPYKWPRRNTRATLRRPSTLSKITSSSTTIYTNGQNDRVTINIAGFQYKTRKETLERYPDTLLGNAEDLSEYYDEVEEEYYFDRNR